MKKLLLLLLAFPSLLFSQTITTIAGDGINGYNGDTIMASTARLAVPSGVVVDNSDNIFITDQWNQRIRKISTSGIITTVAGTGFSGGGALAYTGDNGPATAATFNNPVALALDGNGNMYIVDSGNNAVRKIDAAGIITTVAGCGVGGYSGDNGPATAAKLHSPVAIAVDRHGNLFISDLLNNVVRKVDASGIITTFAGNGTSGFSGDGGPATSAELYEPRGIAVDTAGNVYFGEASVIRKVNTMGIISTFAGHGISLADGVPATDAFLDAILGLYIDKNGYMYFSMMPDHTIRLINPAGIVHTVAGNGLLGYCCDGGPATAAPMNFPYGMATTANGDLIIADINNNRIRKVTNLNLNSSPVVHSVGVTIYPNPVQHTLFISSSQQVGEIMILNMAGQKIFSGKYNSRNAAIDVNDLLPGIYNLQINSKQANVIVKE